MVTMSMMPRKIQPESPPTAPESSARIKLCQAASAKPSFSSGAGPIPVKCSTAAAITTMTKETKANQPMMAIGPCESEFSKR